MKKQRITYGVSGMMDYQCIIRFGKNTLKITFTGGGMNAIGVTPATFSTSSFLVQQAIENSKEYKRGRIRIVSTVDLEEELCIEHPQTAPANEITVSTDKVLESEKTTTESQPDEQGNSATMTQVEFSCNDDAKDYLEQTFGFVRSKLHNREDIVAAGKSKGVDIIFV